jgi:hypothetical protein
LVLAARRPAATTGERYHKHHPDEHTTSHSSPLP